MMTYHTLKDILSPHKPTLSQWFEKELKILRLSRLY